MSLVAWFPLNGNTKNQGLQDLTLIDAHDTHSSVTSTPGKVTQQCYYNTSYSDGGYVTTTKVNLGLNQSMFAWIKFITLTNNSSLGGCVVGTHRYPKNTGMGITLKYVSSTTGYLSVNTGNGSSRTYNTYCGSTLLSANTWYHVGYTFDGTTIKFYVNGKLDGSATNSTITAMSIPEDFLVVGCWSLGTSTLTSNSVYANYKLNGWINDIRVYDHTLTQKEITEISKGLMLHYTFEDEEIEGTANLGNTSATYSNMTEGYTYSTSGWGGDAGTCTYYKSGGYNNYPYKVYHKTATGTGGIYKKTADDIVIEANKTYTMSVYVKASVNITNASAYSFNINRGSDNNYINYGSSFNITTEWQRLVKTFTATSAQAGNYGEMSIIYDDTVTDYYIYYSGFQIEEKDHATPYAKGTRSNSIVYDNSGYGNNGIAIGACQIVNIEGSGKYSLYLPNGVTDYINNANFYWPTEHITTSYWWKSTNKSPTGSYHIPMSSNSPGPYEMSMSNGGVTRNGLYVAGSRKVDNGTSSKLLDGNWHLCTMTYNGSIIKRYVDGVSEKDTSVSGALSGGTGLVLGHYGTDTSYAVKEGYIADFKIFATGLTPEDVLYEYNRKASIDNASNIFTGKFVEKSNSNFKIKQANFIIGDNFTEGTNKVKIGDDSTIYVNKIIEL